MKPRRPATKAELLARMPRVFRPRLDAGQRRDLGLCHIVNLDSIASGTATEDTLWQWVGAVLTWTKTAELMGRHLDAMVEQMGLAARLVNRYRDTGRVLFTGPDYQLAKAGVVIMDDLAEAVDKPTAVQAANWGEAMLNTMSTSATNYRAERERQAQPKHLEAIPA